MPHRDAAVGVAEAIASLRADLSRAVKEGAEESVHFGAGPVELEFLVEVSREGGGGGGVRFWVLSAEAKASTLRHPYPPGQAFPRSPQRRGRGS